MYAPIGAVARGSESLPAIDDGARRTGGSSGNNVGGGGDESAGLVPHTNGNGGGGGGGAVSHASGSGGGGAVSHASGDEASGWSVMLARCSSVDHPTSATLALKSAAASHPLRRIAADEAAQLLLNVLTTSRALFRVPIRQSASGPIRGK